MPRGAWDRRAYDYNPNTKHIADVFVVWERVRGPSDKRGSLCNEGRGNREVSFFVSVCLRHPFTGLAHLCSALVPYVGLGIVGNG